MLQAMRHAKQEPFPTIYVDGKKDGVEYEPVSSAQLKKNKKIFAREGFKNADREKREAEDAERREKNFEEAKKITIEEDKSLPPAKVNLIKTAPEFGRRSSDLMYGSSRAELRTKPGNCQSCSSYYSRK